MLPLKQTLRYRVAKVWLFAHRTLRSIGKAYPVNSFRVLLFHDVAPDQMPAFERMLHYLRNAHRVLSPEEAKSLLSGQPLNADNGRIPYLLTFDDGFLSHARVAKDILDQYDAKGLFFVCPGLIDVPKEQHSGLIAKLIFDGAVASQDLPNEMGLMSWSDVETLSASGHTIGSHSSTHRRLSGLGKDELEQEILGAGIRLEERLGVHPDWFAYPFGDLPSINQESLDAIGSRYRFCCSGIRGVNSEKVHPLGLLREQLDFEGPFDYQKLVVEGGLDFYYVTSTKLLQGLADNTTEQSANPDNQT
jgi:peptidoglycan/xylan/chitin deacetylase (PgdA/CDA1 family)